MSRADPPRMGWWVNDGKHRSRHQNNTEDFPLSLADLHNDGCTSIITDGLDKFSRFAGTNFSSQSLVTLEDRDYELGHSIPHRIEPGGGSAFVWGWSDHDGEGQNNMAQTEPLSQGREGAYVRPELRYISCSDALHNAADFRAWLARLGDTPSGIGNRQEMIGHIQRHASALVDNLPKLGPSSGGSWPDRIKLNVAHHQGVLFNDISIETGGDKIWSPEGNWNSDISFGEDGKVVVLTTDRNTKKARFGFPADYEAERQLANYCAKETHNLMERSPMHLSRTGTWRCTQQAFREVAMTSRMMQILASPDRGGRADIQKANVHPRPHISTVGALMHIYEMMRIVHVEKSADGTGATAYLASSMGEFISPAMEPDGFGGEAYGQSLPLFCIPVNMVGGRDDLTFGDWIVVGTHAIPSGSHAVEILTAVHGENGVYDVMKPNGTHRTNTVLVGIRDRVINLPDRTLTKHYFSPPELMHMAVASERVVTTHTVDETQVKMDARNMRKKWVPTWKDNRGRKTLNLAGRKKVRLHDVVRCSTCNGKVEIKADIGNTAIVGKCPHCSEDSVHFPHLVMGADIPKSLPARSQ